MRAALLAFAVVLTTASLPAVASAQAPMTLQDAVSYALERDPTVALKFAAVTAQAHAVAVQSGQTFPTVAGTLQNIMQKQVNYGGAYALIGLTPQAAFSQNTASVGTTYTLNSGGLGLIQLAAANATLAQAREDLARSEDLIASTVTDAFFNVAQKDGLVALDRSDLGYQNSLVAAARIKARAGVSAGVDVLRARVAQAKSASTLVAAEADAQDAREALAHTVGVPLRTVFAVPTTVPEPPLPRGSIDTLESIAVAARPDVISARKALLAARETRKGWIREFFPSLQITAAMGNQYSPTESVSLQNALDAQITAENQQRALNHLPPLPFPVVPRGSPGFWQLGLTSTFTLPLVDYGQHHTERINDDAQIASAQAALAQAVSQAQVDIRQQYRAAQTAQAQLAYAKEEASLGAESARIAQLQYRNGVIALADVFQAQQTSVQAQTDLVDARVSYVDAVVALRVALGIFDPRSAVADL
ncbi:MAG TPA: TolC family protein [Candidatus Tyrphobacter sp.]